MYNIEIQYSHTLQNNYQGKSSFHLSPYKDIALLLTIPHAIYLIPVTHLFYNWKFDLLISLSYNFFLPITSPLVTTLLVFCIMSLFPFCYVWLFVF